MSKPRELQLNPLEHEFFLRVVELEEGSETNEAFADVSFRLGEIRGEAVFVAEHAERIGRWFLDLSKTLRSSNLKAKRAQAAARRKALVEKRRKAKGAP